MEFLPLIKQLLRINHSSLDDVIKFNIAAALQDMAEQGVDVDSQDETVTKAVELYCKWHMNHNGEADRYQKLYEGLRNTMSEQTEYRSDDNA